MALGFRGALVVSVALLSAAPVLAADLAGQVTDQVRVPRTWVAEGSATPQQALARLSRAAMEACGASSFSVPDQKYAVRNSSCFQTSMNEAIAQVGSPALADAFHRRATVEVAGGGQVGTRLR